MSFFPHPKFHFPVSCFHHGPSLRSYCYSFGSVSLSEYTHMCIQTQRGKKEIKKRKKPYLFSLTRITYFIPFGNFLFYLKICIRDKPMPFHSPNAFFFNSIFKIGNIHVAILLLVDIDIVSSCSPAMLNSITY